MLPLALLSSCGGCEQQEPYTGDPNPLYSVHKVYGRVKTLKTEYFDIIMREGKMAPGSHVGETITFDTIDAQGRMLLTRIYAVGGGLKKTERFTYSGGDDITGIESLNSNGDATTHQELYYNEKGQKIKQVVTIHLPEGDEFYWRSWEYDSIGQMVETFVFKSDSTLDNRETVIYYPNDSGKIHIHSLYVGYDSLKYRNEYVYNQAGQDSILHRYRPLDDKGTVGYQSRYEYTYNDRGEELTRNLISPEGQIKAAVKYEYEYDDYNWIRRYEIVDGELNVVKVRTYTYYE